MWVEWIKERKELNKPVTTRGAIIQLKKLAEWGAATAIENSIAGGWSNIYEDKPKSKKSKDDDCDSTPF
jgi:hypothetical protein